MLFVICIYWNDQEQKQLAESRSHHSLAQNYLSYVLMLIPASIKCIMDAYFVQKKIPSMNTVEELRGKG